MTLQQLRLNIEVFDIIEDDKIISIGYWYKDTMHRLDIDKHSDDPLLEWVDGRVSQYDAINIVVQFEEQRAREKFIKNIFQ